LSCLILGASGGLGRALCYRFAAARHDLIIVSSDERDLAAMESDLELRFGVRVSSVAVDFSQELDYRERLRGRGERDRSAAALPIALYSRRG
jgi:short-subunit dehydrogenase